MITLPRLPDGINPPTKIFKRNGRSYDLRGERFGRLIAKHRTHTASEKFKTTGKKVKPAWYWICDCDCGKQVFVRAASLLNGKSKSCGCWSRQKLMKPTGESAFNCWFLQVKHYAEKRRGLEWGLTKEKAREIILSNCFYCGVEPRRALYKIPCANGTLITNGIDRKDNNKGYTVENCVPCCWTCNAAKRNLPYNDWMNWIKRLTAFQNKNENKKTN